MIHRSILSYIKDLQQQAESGKTTRIKFKDFHKTHSWKCQMHVK
jgi:hypothetical protein